jgi:phage shock protein E
MRKVIHVFYLVTTLFAVASCNAQHKVPDYTNAMLVDVRTEEEFAGGSVKGAVNIPVDEVEDRLAEFGHDRQIVVFCRSGSRSSRAMSILKSHGYDNVSNGGTWQQVNDVINSKKSK